MSEVRESRVDFEIKRECADWLVVDKPAPLIVHPTSQKKEPTLVTLLEHYFLERKEDVTLSLINRLDRETSGLVLVAKNAQAARVFGKAMMRREIKKRYQVILKGWPQWEEQRVEASLIRRGEVEELTGNFVWVRQIVHEQGKRAVTTVKVNERFLYEGNPYTHGEVYTETGRMHQIRVHCEYLGFPLVGDKIYGGDESCYLDFVESGWSAELKKKLLLNRQALHASQLEFEWGGETQIVESQLPQELMDFLSKS